MRLLKWLLSSVTRAPRHDPPQDYLRWYYDHAIWKGVMYRGVRTLKFVPDLWNYQEILQERNVQYVIETGTRHGGSALFFADCLRAMGRQGFVISVDVDSASRAVPEDERIQFLLGDSSSAEMASRIAALLPPGRAPGTAFWILDSDHTAAHVLAELRRLVPLMLPGDYLVVEDTCVNGHPVRADFGPGPWEGVAAYKAEHPGQLLAQPDRELRFGATFAPNGYYVRGEI